MQLSLSRARAQNICFGAMCTVTLAKHFVRAIYVLARTEHVLRGSAKLVGNVLLHSRSQKVSKERVLATLGTIQYDVADQHLCAVVCGQRCQREVARARVPRVPRTRMRTCIHACARLYPHAHVRTFAHACARKHTQRDRHIKTPHVAVTKDTYGTYKDTYGTYKDTYGTYKDTYGTYKDTVTQPSTLDWDVTGTSQSRVEG